MLQGINIRCRNCGKLEKICINNGPLEIERFFFNKKTGDYKKIIEKCKFGRLCHNKWLIFDEK